MRSQTVAFCLSQSVTTCQRWLENPEIARKFRKLHLDDMLYGLADTISVKPGTTEGWLIMRLRTREQVDDAIDFWEKRATAQALQEGRAPSNFNDPEWIDWKKSVGYRQGKKRK